MGGLGAVLELRRRLPDREVSPNLLMGRFLQALYPSASFVFIVRHPVTVTLATRKWRRRTPLPRLMKIWFTAYRAAKSDLPHLDHVPLVRYEWLLADQAAANATRPCGEICWPINTATPSRHPPLRAIGTRVRLRPR